LWPNVFTRSTQSFECSIVADFCGEVNPVPLQWMQSKRRGIPLRQISVFPAPLQCEQRVCSSWHSNRFSIASSLRRISLIMASSLMLEP
jgi:hypothetical protein